MLVSTDSQKKLGFLVTSGHPSRSSVPVPTLDGGGPWQVTACPILAEITEAVHNTILTSG